MEARLQEGAKTVAKQMLDLLQIIAELISVIVWTLYYLIELLFKVIYPRTLKSVKDEIVLITGAGHGIGKELALLYASEGAKVVCWDINVDGNKKTIEEIEHLGYIKPYSYICDVSNRKDVLEIAKKVRGEVGDVTILINNAGIMPTHPVEEHTEQEIDKILDINVKAHFWTIEAFLPGMRKLNHGHIVALSSIAGLVGLINLVPYCASKFAVRGLMESLTEELRLNKDNKIETTTIYPYMVDTGLCKRPFIKFPSLMPLLEPKDVALAIMNAQRSDTYETSIPQYLFPLNNLARVLPIKASRKMKDFFDSGVHSDL